MIVTGVAPVTTQERALQDQRLAPNVEDVQSAEQISKYPDVNLADSIKRMPGPAFRMIPEKVFYIGFVNAGYSEQVHRQIFNLSGLDDANTGGPLLGPTPSPDGSFTASDVVMSEDLRFNLEHFENWIVQGGGRDVLGPFIIDYKGSFAQAWDDNPHDFNPSFSTDASETVRRGDECCVRRQRERARLGPDPAKFLPLRESAGKLHGLFPDRADAFRDYSEYSANPSSLLHCNRPPRVQPGNGRRPWLIKRI